MAEVGQSVTTGEHGGDVEVELKKSWGYIMADFLSARKFWLYLASGIQDFARGFSGGEGGEGDIVGVEHMFIKMEMELWGLDSCQKSPGCTRERERIMGYRLSKRKSCQKQLCENVL